MDTCQTVIAPPTIVTQTPIDVKLTEEHTQIVDDLEDLASADLALESYRGLLNAAAKNGITRQSAMALKIGLQRIDRKLGRTQVALESLDIGKRDMFQISLEDEQKLIGERKGSILEKGKELIKKLIEKFKELFQRAKDLIASLPKRAERLKADVKHWVATAGKQINISGYTYLWLVKDGKPMGPADAAAFVKFIGEATSAVGQNLDAALAKRDLGALPKYSGPKPNDVSIEVTDKGYEVDNDYHDGSELKLPVRRAEEVERDLDALSATSKDLQSIAANRIVSLLNKSITTSVDESSLQLSNAIYQIGSLGNLVRAAERVIAAQLARVEAENRVFKKKPAKEEEQGE